MTPWAFLGTRWDVEIIRGREDAGLGSGNSRIKGGAWAIGGRGQEMTGVLVGDQRPRHQAPRVEASFPGVVRPPKSHVAAGKMGRGEG